MNFATPEKENTPDEVTTYIPKHAASSAFEGKKMRFGAVAGGITAIAAAAFLTLSSVAGQGGPLVAVPAPPETAVTTPAVTSIMPPSFMLPKEEVITQQEEQAELRKLQAASRAEARAAAAAEKLASLTPPPAAAGGPRIIAENDRLAWPVKNHGVSSNFGPRSDPFTQETRFHTGMDFGGACGTPIYAAESGEVTAAGNTNGGYGIRIVINHRPDLSTTYNHLQQILVKEGDKVQVGDKIALMGTTGRSTGCHLHFEVMKDGKYVSPWSWLTGEADKVTTAVPAGTIFTVKTPNSATTSNDGPDKDPAIASPSVTATPTPTSTPTPIASSTPEVKPTPTTTPSPTATSTPTPTTTPSSPTSSPTATTPPASTTTSTPSDPVPTTSSPAPTKATPSAPTTTSASPAASNSVKSSPSVPVVPTSSKSVAVPEDDASTS